MTPPRIFISSGCIIDKTATISGSDVNYVKNVMRLKEGSPISLIDSESKEYEAKIRELGKSYITAEITAEKEIKAGPKIKVTIAQCLPKNPKMEIVVQKATELGAFEMIPVNCERTVIKLREDKVDAKVSRWRKIAKEAAEQSGRNMVPTIKPISEFKALLSLSKNYDKCIMLWEMEKEKTLKTFLQANREIKSLLVLIGPEGGISHEEADDAIKAGFEAISIGNRILRTETAPLAVLAMINYEFEL
jgi:16S rRNA (uracil1498-N3)-methyltransferase